MSNFVTWTLAVAMCVGTTAALAIHYPFSQPRRSSESQLALDGAYRDGLYVGNLAVRSGRRARPPIGRWSSEKDRASFRVGYENTYNARSNQPENENQSFNQRMR